MRPENWRQKGILDAAMQCFLERGFRGTSMEFVAQRSNVAKATLYKYYPDKHQLFGAVVAAFFADFQDRNSGHWDEEQPLAGQVAQLLIAKHRAVDEVLEKSSHAEEIRALYQGQQIDAFSEFETWLIAQITAQLEQRNVPVAHRRASSLIAAAYGLYHKRDLLDDWEAEMTALCHMYVSV